ncbi:5-methyltetrahydropteroyltriglutamate--homocysteine methyltransferase [Sphingomonas kaistensis]|uniref:5-methyltetrahydropteroyltriglutamate--homocysteine methyltransferase n=1 Tax=Sphingomonas kaistensis TaxID=298708 RepID=A0A7X6BF57_9SPHN|nr:5-methyltetrahydropteroyltriglutamate--homocysteine S-methyltransferase [Sphingomonas kaistensis]NJC04418.1 5-methyltetrahydropteroyltriglutamate--homocysteine methyltransferase [Sphingomonas kaistensis]
MTKPPFRADHVGSFLRPKPLIEARAAHRDGTIDAARLREVEDEAIRDVVAMQEGLGLQSITDGEFRRTYFHTDFLLQLDGVDEAGGTQVKFHQHGGKELAYAPPVMKITGPIRHVADIQRADYEFLASCTTRTPKVTIPSPTMLHFRGGRDAIDAEAYPDLEDFYTDLAAAYRAEIASLADAGCRYLQLDDTNLAYLCDDTQRENARKRGMDPDELPRLYARLINDSIRDRPDNMVVGVHLCRGNYRSSWAAEGGYEPVAEVLFNELEIDSYFLEYDDPRSGDFAPLRFLPKGKTVVLGLVTTKLGELEQPDDIRRRIDEAAKFAPLDQLALSPQCGFSSTVHGNDIEVEQQAAKMKLVIDVADQVWGKA